MSQPVVQLDPVMISLGPVQIRWYGFMYVVSFVIGWCILRYLAKTKFFKIPVEKVDSLLNHIFVGMFLGARLAYVFIYNWDYYSNHLLQIPAIWMGGLSFHGALAGVLVGGYIFGRRNNVSWPQVMDSIALAGSQGLFWGRMGNFINGELYGRVTDSAFGLIFPAGGPEPRHPSQLYEGVMEGLVLTAILWFLKGRVKYHGIIASTFLLGYGFFRYFVEFFREADPQLGYYLGGTTTMGQILCFIMMFVSIYAYYYSLKVKDKV